MEIELLRWHLKKKNFYDMCVISTCEEKGTMVNHDHLKSLALKNYHRSRSLN